ncbi:MULTISPECIES: LacI family DNA-binding transcriptional regulator [Cryobacterium]|uniref:LacI family DNA-binding transcriptional regulator n=1 Tax=Cryobacterium glucosi TaxID=1259175 RepID=A0ABY2IN92_9MICO|nr:MULTISPECIES: LacI family DNA-binding transcriptional regulator [Cryobacterium]TFC00927.1 LacI family DNA-binding transcriptional regulator [Cryobacterium sp. MDB2-A-1]TFC13107.1 LacI family DNA-binding transcriptional regulator [Cryobacterium sp. MDB2-A-2]TFC19141.1 LacI family DNA-binding transcriptional regulator [Cryobacterium glucosi]TFC23917.1 LacI family DNA-binding transcriptional regulator [Cryobacterium sp. MDB2-10]
MVRRQVSMQDIARNAGVSRSTVSFVLNERTDISIPEETRARVREAARQLGYRPNVMAQSLAKESTNLIGLVTDIASSPFAGGIINGAQQAAWRLGKFLLIVSTEGDPARDEAALEMLLERRVEGLIYATQAHKVVALPSAAREVPTVLAHCVEESGEFPSVLPDEEQGGFTATRHLIEAGHQRIALINLDTAMPAARLREAGYRRALREARIEVDDRMITVGHATANGGFHAARTLLDGGEVPTALFCANDRMAMGAYDAIKEAGLHVPDDVSVVGFDNQEIIAAYLRPALTTVALPFERMGAAAVEVLSSVHGSAGCTPLLVPCPLVKRGSVA